MNDRSEEVDEEFARIEKELKKFRHIKRVKHHFQNNWKYYAVGGIGVVIGTAGLFAYMVKHGQAVADDQIRKLVTDDFNRWHKQDNMYKKRISKYGNQLGNPGTPVYDVATRKRYESIILAALDADAPYHKVIRQLNGELDYVNGRKFAYCYPKLQHN